MKGLDPDVQHRYPSINALADDIRAILNGKAITARRESMTQKSTRWIKGHRTLSFTIAMAMCILFGVLVYHYISITTALHRFEMEKKRAEATLVELREEIDLSLKANQWNRVENLAIRIQALDPNDTQSHDILQQVEVNRLEEAMPLIFHPASGTALRKKYYHLQEQRWQACFDSGNPKAAQQLKQIQQQLQQEESASSTLHQLKVPGTLLQDQYGLAFLHPLGMKFRYIPPGKFDRGDEEHSPIRSITISKGFFLMETELTQSQWERLGFLNDSDFIGPNHPITTLEFGGAMGFAQALNEKDGFSRKIDSLWDAGYRLPTEAEWEYACRADIYPNQPFWWEKERLKGPLPLWFDENSGEHGHSHIMPSAQWLPNPWGLHDMHGNAFEWVLDSYDDTFYKTSPTIDPFHQNDTIYKVIRGGSFRNRLFHCRASKRVKVDAETMNDQIGFRLCFIPSS